MFSLFKKKVIVRMAPSPTGNFHIGTARTTLYNYLYARKLGGKFILRIEDTDKERSKKEYEDNILDGIKWLGLAYDEFYRQSERENLYKEYLKKLIDTGKAYVSKEEPKEEGQPTSPRLRGPRRSEVIRFKNPNKKIRFKDLIRGEVEFDTTELGDFVIAKSLEEPLYHLAVVVDDHIMEVTHIIRGEDHISNTPRHILIQEAIGAKRPVYAHLPLILAQDRSKLSKRKHGESVSVDFYRRKGTLPEALVNYLALIGWNPGTDREVFTLKELVKEFELEKVHKGGAIFDEKKLDWLNKEHIKLLSPQEQLELKKKEIADEPYMHGLPELNIEKMNWKNTDKSETLVHLEYVKDLLHDENAVMKYAEEKGKGNVLWPLRYSLTGAEKSPDPFTLIRILGAEESRKRVERAVELLK